MCVRSRGTADPESGYGVSALDCRTHACDRVFHRICRVGLIDVQRAGRHTQPSSTASRSHQNGPRSRGWFPTSFMVAAS